MVRRHAWFHFPSFMPAFILLCPLSRSSYQHISSFTAFCSGPVTMVLLIAWWRYTALYLALLSLVCLPVAEMKHTADPHKPLSQNCIAKVQRTMDCVLSGPKSRWVNGQRINYDYMKVIGKSGWDTCNRPVADYVWNHSTDCARHHLKSTYSRQEMCKIIQGKKIMIVGDSINNQLFVTFASMMWPPSSIVQEPKDDNFQHFDRRVFKDKDGSVTSDYRDSGYNNVAINIPCEDLKHSFTLYFVRNFNISINSVADDYFYSGNGQIYKDVPRPWFDRIGMVFSTKCTLR
jgi:hypothetical protein